MKITGKLAASNLLTRQGIELDTDKKCYQNTNKILSLFTVKSSCKPIPKPDYVLIFRTLYAKCEACSVEDFDSSSLVQLSLVYRKNRRLIINEGGSLIQSVEMARSLASELGLKIRDSATDRRNPVWITV